MVNKLNGAFTKADEESFETFAIYCGLALHHAKVRADKEFTCRKEHNDIIDHVLLLHVESSISFLAFMQVCLFIFSEYIPMLHEILWFSLKVSGQVVDPLTAYSQVPCIPIAVPV